MKKYSGKAKTVTLLDNNKVKITFRDSISAFDGKKIEELTNKGEINCKTSAKIFEILNNYGFETHYESSLSQTELLCRRVEIIPVEVVCRNYSAGSFCRRYGLEKGLVLDSPVVEFFLKEDDLHDPLVTKEVAIQMRWLSLSEAVLMEAVTRAVNSVMSRIFSILSLELVDFKLEFGRTPEGKVIIADEISADTMRLWEKETGEIKDKDRYREDMGDVIIHYKDILDRLLKLENLPEISIKTIANVIIKLKDSVLDPAGEVTLRSLKRKGYQDIDLVRLGKSAVISFNLVPSSKIQDLMIEISQNILSNPLIENYTYEIFSSPKQ